MKWKDFWDCPEEIFIGAMLQFPLYFIVHWWILLIMPACGLLWRLGGVTGGVKWARWALVPLLICTVAYLFVNSWTLFLAAPFMVKLMPFSYGKSGWLFKWLKNDFLVRILGYVWYWSVFSFCLIVG